MRTNALKIFGIITTFMCSLNALADNIQYGGLSYQTIDNSNNVIVVAGTEKYTLPQYKIPDTFVYQNITYTVTGIGKNAFYGCGNLISIELPSTISTIGEWAFYNSGIRKIEMPNVVSIEEYAFGLCSNLSNINLPTSLTTIGKSAFSSSGLRNIEINSSVSSIGKGIFANCEKLMTISVNSGNSLYESPNGCNAIINKKTKVLIAGCSGTQNIPNDVVAIDDNAFYGSGLTSISLPQSVTSIGDWAFYSNSNLQSVELPNNLVSIGECAFGLCSRLKEIQLPPSLLSIGKSAFSSSGLTSIFIPKSVMLVGKNAFSNCEGLLSIQVESGNEFYESPNNCNAIIQSNILVSGCTGTKNIPENVTTIGENAFYGSGITDISLPNSVTNIEEWAFYNCNYLKSISMSDNLKYVDEYAFGLCTKLAQIILPSTMKSIGRSTFSGCGNLKKIYSMIQSPFAIEDNVFDEVLFKEATLYVPTGTKATYEQTSGWNFSTIEEFDPTGIASPTIAGHRMHSANGVIYIEGTTNGNCSIYAVSGQLMRKVELKQGVNTVEGLSKGVYIVNGQKILIH